MTVSQTRLPGIARPVTTPRGGRDAGAVLARTTYFVLDVPSEWKLVWSAVDQAVWDDGVVGRLAKEAALPTVFAAFDDGDPRGSRIELVFNDGSDRFARKISVLGGRKVSTLALGTPLHDEPQRSILEAHVERRDAAGGLRELLIRTGFPDVWNPSLWDEAADVIAVTQSLRGLAPVLGGPTAGPKSDVSKALSETPPRYLAPYARRAEKAPPATLLLAGEFCGHGEPRFGVWDVEVFGATALFVEVPGAEDPGWAVVRVASPARPGEPVLVYDSREVVSMEASGDEEPTPTSPLHCTNCGARTFRVSVGFEIHGESESPEDTSWFALAVRCTKCRRAEIAWDHESA